MSVKKRKWIAKILSTTGKTHFLELTRLYNFPEIRNVPSLTSSVTLERGITFLGFVGGGDDTVYSSSPRNCIWLHMSGMSPRVNQVCHVQVSKVTKISLTFTNKQNSEIKFMKYYYEESEQAHRGTSQGSALRQLSVSTTYVQNCFNPHQYLNISRKMT